MALEEGKHQQREPVLQVGAINICKRTLHGDDVSRGQLLGGGVYTDAADNGSKHEPRLAPHRLTLVGSLCG